MGKYSFFTGLATAIVVLLISGLSGSWRTGMNVAGLIGIVGWLISAVFTGALVSGDRMRVNEAIEDPKDRQVRLRWSRWFFLFGLPNILLAVSVYLAAFKS